MRNYNQQIEDAYAGSKRQGDMMRNREIERSASQSRRNRYRDDKYQLPQQQPFDSYSQTDVQHPNNSFENQGIGTAGGEYPYYATRRQSSSQNRRRDFSRGFGSSEYNEGYNTVNDFQRPEQMTRHNYPETYRSAMSGYMSEHVGEDRGRKDYYQNGDEGNLYGNRYGLHKGKGPKNYRRTDQRIKDDINDKLTDDPRVDASEIDVQVNKCEVVLNGSVSDRSQKRRAEDIVESVSGVMQVENRLRVTASSQ